ncbi:hypothetical protein DAEQUDRAFT_766058 [Daedalea quercina L-15889]|uniref:Uncharacterized protein n=1 Tax=Daedalea quercina L-15889 TaxID=1314783 RepID=A0A165PUT8_9APHY|nr:hypothetical protein DAEQUDRAFT_766058 [Daedalea quercina L-15889]
MEYPACVEDDWGVGETYAPCPTQSDPSRRLPDVRSISVFRARWLVSRKRTTNLMDLAGLWKRTVLGELERRVVEENDPAAPVQRVLEDFFEPSAPAPSQTPEAPPQEDLQASNIMSGYISNLGQARVPDADSDEEMWPQRRRSPPPPPGWYGF